MYRRYQGNSGQSRRVPEPDKIPGQFQGKRLAPLLEPEKRPPPPPRPGKPQAAPEFSPPGPSSGLSGGLDRLFGKLGNLRLETEDLLLIAVLYLMYRESGDKELLIMIGALLFL